MASYFEEHGTEDETTTYGRNQLLEISRILQRLLLQTSELDLALQFDGILQDSNPASKEFVCNLDTVPPSSLKNENCPVCLAHYKSNDLCKQLPCKHHFHADCILPWLGITNTCPLCRREYPTDNVHREEKRREMADEEARTNRLQSLFDSMFS